MVTGFDYLGRENFRDPVLIGIYFLGTIGLHFDGLGRQNFRKSVVVLVHIQGIGGIAGFDGRAWKNRWDTVLGWVFLVSLGCKAQAEKEGNEGQDLGFYGFRV
jgi:hypothetical protein